MLDERFSRGEGELRELVEFERRCSMPSYQPLQLGLSLSLAPCSSFENIVLAWRKKSLQASRRSEAVPEQERESR